jgi:hypothetical protein
MVCIYQNQFPARINFTFLSHHAVVVKEICLREAIMYDVD